MLLNELKFSYVMCCSFYEYLDILFLTFRPTNKKIYIAVFEWAVNDPSRTRSIHLLLKDAGKKNSE